jgi:hypothetical protein
LAPQTILPTQDQPFAPPGCAPTRTIEGSFPPRAVADSDATALNDAAVAVNARIQALGLGLPVSGGTPTAASLRFVAAAPGLFDLSDLRRDIIVLVTDGLPFCNTMNPSSCSSVPPPPAERCLLNPTPNPAMLNNCRGRFCAAGYLDDTGTVQAITDLRTRGVETLVIGLGTNLGTALATDTLNAMAPRRCPDGTNVECGAGGTCGSGGVCSRQFFAAANATELAQVLAALPARLVP